MTQSAMESTYGVGPAALIIADDGPAGDAAAEAIELAGGRLLGRVGWREAVERLERQGVLGVVMIEAEAVDDALVEAMLPHIDALAQAGDTRVVIAFADRQIDLVTAHLLGGDANLLCMPSVAGRVTALMSALVPHSRDRLHDARRDAESVRLRRLNEEVARIAEILARLTREQDDELLEHSGGLADRVMDFGASPEIDGPPPLARDVREVIRARRLRDQYFERGLFEDPAWDMLLDLFAADLEHAQVSVSSLCIAASVAPTTALRWISKMTEAGLFVRQADPSDRRRAFMVLSPTAREAMRGYFIAVKRGGIPAA